MSDPISQAAVESKAASEVLSRFPAPLRGGSIRPLGNSGGFSGATIFRITNTSSDFCLRGGPADCKPANLAWIHCQMRTAREAGLTFVPCVFEASDSTTVIYHLGRLWELQDWMPGRAEFNERPSATKLENACLTLAQLHAAWADTNATVQPCPAVRRRLEGIRRWQAFAVKEPSVSAVATRAHVILPRWLAQVVSWLHPWVNEPVPVHPCLCDIWHDHLLFTEDHVTGVIDYGAMKVDHAAVDLARLLGSLVGDDDVAWHTGLRAYRSVRAFSDEDERLAHILDVTGTVLGVVNWLMRIAVEQRTEAEQGVVARRLETLVRRIEGWETKTPLAAER